MFDASTGMYSLSAEQQLCLADPNGPVDLPGASLTSLAMFHARDRAVENFRTGKGMEWGEHHSCLFCGTERLFRAGYNTHLLSSWIPALDGVQAKLARGAKFADVGCGHGASTILLAKAFPKSEFIGYDYHRPSIEIAAQRAKEAGVTNPAGAAQYARAALRSDGTCMVVEPFAGDEVTDNLTPLGRNPDIVPKLSDVSVAGAILGDDREPRVWGLVRYRGDL